MMEMQIHDRHGERRVGIAIAFDGENTGAFTRLRRFQNNLVRDIATGQDYIGIAFSALPVEIVDVG